MTTRAQAQREWLENEELQKKQFQSELQPHTLENEENSFKDESVEFEHLEPSSEEDEEVSQSIDSDQAQEPMNEQLFMDEDENHMYTEVKNLSYLGSIDLYSCKSKR